MMLGLSLGLPGYGGGGAAVPEADVIRVRRSSDSTEADYTLTEWDDGTLDTFVGAGDGCLATWYDQSGNDNDVTQATTTLQPKVAISGTVQEGVVFDGTDDYMSLGARVTTGAPTALTVAAFVKTAATGKLFISEYNTASPGWILGTSATGKLRVILRNSANSNTKDYSSATSINTNTWRHIAFTFDNDVLLLYVDGTLETATKTTDLSVTAILSTSAPFAIGAYNVNTTPTSFVAGAISNVFIQQSAFTAGNIATLAAGGEVGSPLLWLKGNYSP